MIPASCVQLGRWEERVSATDWDSVRAEGTVPEPGGRTYTLLDADRRLYRSAAPGRFGGHRKSRIYGRLDCPAALRAIVGSGYAAHRVFFADERTAVAAGYRPCAVCLPGAYAAWKAR
jgi:hypothetical protein